MNFKKKSLFKKLFQPYLLLVSSVLLIFAVLLAKSFKTFYLQQTRGDLERVANIITEDIKEGLIDSAGYNTTYHNYENLTGIRITLIDTSGKVISDSRVNSETMDKHNTREEVITAKSGETGYSVRKSYTLDIELMYVAVPVKDRNGNITRIIRVSASLDALNKEFNIIYIKIIISIFVLFIAASLAGYFLSKRIVRPLTGIKENAERYSSGDFSESIRNSGVEEYDALSDSLNNMSLQISEKLKIIKEQYNLNNAVLESMKEGVVAVDNEMNILFVNTEASKILNLDKEKVTGKTVQEAIRLFDFQEFIVNVLNSGENTVSNLIMQGEMNIYLELTGAVLKTIENKTLGVLVVLNNISQTKHLDNLKKDFVANVSHELKTPITTIKGFVELLLDGAMADEKNLKKFLLLISKNTERLNLIIDDLLLLSKVEQLNGNRTIKFKPHSIKDIIYSVIDTLKHKAKEKDIFIECECSDNLLANVNGNLLEQAVLNLTDNALKYSPEGTKIFVNAAINENQLEISVRDFGCGIEPEDIPRLFERFYRIDKSRSREEGGTGLGLSIVKHIAQVHNGTVKVESEVGKGSIFTISIPV